MTRDFLALLVGIFGNVSSTFVFAAPLVTFYHIIKKRSTESFSPVPYVTCMLSQILWVYYGILKPKGLIIVTISAVGFIFEIFYLCIFVVFGSKPHRMYALKLIALSLITFLVLFLGTFFGSTSATRLSIVGFLCAINAIGMFASPLIVMKRVITTKNVDYMPFLLSLSLFINGGTWATYSIIARDIFMGVPSGLGFVFGAVQLLLYSCYYKQKPTLIGAKSMDEIEKPAINDHNISIPKGEDFHQQSQYQIA